MGGRPTRGAARGGARGGRGVSVQIGVTHSRSRQGGHRVINHQGGSSSHQGAIRGSSKGVIHRGGLPARGGCPDRRPSLRGYRERSLGQSPHQTPAAPPPRERGAPVMSGRGGSLISMHSRPQAAPPPHERGAATNWDKGTLPVRLSEAHRATEASPVLLVRHVVEAYGWRRGRRGVVRCARWGQRRARTDDTARGRAVEADV